MSDPTQTSIHDLEKYKFVSVGPDKDDVALKVVNPDGTNIGGGGGGGGGTQYPEGSTASPATGNAILFRDGPALNIPSVTDPLPVEIIGDVVIDSTTPVDVAVTNAVVIDDTTPIEVNVTNNPLMTGTVDGTPSGVQRTIVNNKKQQVLLAQDLVLAYTWLDFGTKQERVSTIIYTSATFLGETITRTFAYTLVGNNYRLDTETWTSSGGG